MKREKKRGTNDFYHREVLISGKDAKQSSFQVLTTGTDDPSL